MREENLTSGWDSAEKNGEHSKLFYLKNLDFYLFYLPTGQHHEIKFSTTFSRKHGKTHASFNKNWETNPT